MNYVNYQPHPIGRWRTLFGEKPEATFDADRTMRAVQASVHFAGAGVKALAECQQGYNLLHIIQLEILQDAAVLAFSREVTALIETLEKVRIPALAAVRDQRRAAILPLHERCMALKKQCDEAVNQCYRDESAQWFPKAADRDRLIAGLQEKLAAAKLFAAETGQEVDAEAARIPAQIEQLQVDYEAERTRICRERDARIAELKRVSEETKSPIWQEYRAELDQSQQDFEAAVKEARREHSEAVKALNDVYEVRLRAARAQVDAVYAPLYQAERAMQAAAQAFIAQMTAVRADSAQATSAGVSSFFAAPPAENEAQPDTTGDA